MNKQQLKILQAINDLLRREGHETADFRPKIKLFVVVRKGIADEPDTVWGIFSTRAEAEEKAKKCLTYYYIEKDIVRIDHDIIEKAYKECIKVK